MKFSDCSTLREKEEFLRIWHKTVLLSWFQDEEKVSQMLSVMPPDVAVKKLMENQVREAYSEFNYHSQEISSLEDLWRG